MEKQTRIILPESIRRELEEIVLKSGNNKQLNLNAAIMDSLNNFIRNSLKGQNAILYNKIKRTKPYERYTIERAWGSRPGSGNGCSLAFANVICCFLKSGSSNLKLFSVEREISETAYEITQKSQPLEEGVISLFEESELINSQPSRRKGKQAHFESLIIQKLKDRYGKGDFNNIPIWGQIQTKEIPIGSSYIDISYVNRQELKTTNDHFLIEKEGLEYKRGKRTQSEIFTNFFSISVISEKLVLRNEHLILIGNPGVGKTIYAKWLCNKWATSGIHCNRMPIYIACRELPNTNRNRIVQYICDQLAISDYETVWAFLISIDSKYQLILDGFDEASFPQRRRLEKDIKDLANNGSYPPFVLLSRPYALIDTPIRRIPAVYELIGFNNLSRKKFVHVHMNDVRAKQRQEFLDLISNHDVLRELSYTPLYLSYMISVFRGKQGYDTLKSIQSNYELNSKAMEFIMNYHIEGRGIERADFIKELEPCKQFIADMELDFSFVYHQKGVMDENYCNAEILSKLGLGRLEMDKSREFWSFYILNVHYQEHITTDHFGRKLTKEALLYLLGNPRYWYLAKMLVGFLVTKGKTDILTQIFNELRRDLKRAVSHNSRLYFILLGELPGKLLNDIIKYDEISYLVEFYRWLHNDVVWNCLYFESLTKIYGKLDEKNISQFDALIVLLLDVEMAVPDIKEIDEMPSEGGINFGFPSFLMHIIESLSLFQKGEIAELLLKKHDDLQLFAQAFYQLKEKREQGKIVPSIHEVRLEDDLDDSIFHTLSILSRISDPRLLEPYREKFWEAFMLARRHHYIIIRIMAKVKTEDFFIHEFERLYGSRKRLQPDHLIYLALMCLGMTATSPKKKVSTKAEACLNKLSVKLRDYLSKSPKNSYLSLIEARANFALALALTDDPHFYDELVWANNYNSYNEDGYYMMDNVSTNFISEKIETFFKKAENSEATISDLLEFKSIVGSADNGYLLMLKFYPNFLAFIRDLIINYKDDLNKGLKGLVPNQKSFIEVPISLELTAAASSTLRFPIMKKMLLDDLFSSDLMQLKYIREYYIFFLLGCEIPFYEKKYWDFIISYLSAEAPDISLILNILEGNEIVFLYEANLKQLALVWEKLSRHIISLRDKQILTLFGDIVKSTHRTMCLNYELHGKSDPYFLCHSIGAVLQLPVFRKCIYMGLGMHVENDVSDLTVYPLMSLYSNSTEFVLGDEFYNLLKMENYTRMGNFFSELARLADYKPSVFKKSLGKKLYESFEKFCATAIKEEYPVIPEIFKEKLK